MLKEVSRPMAETNSRPLESKERWQLLLSTYGILFKYHTKMQACRMKNAEGRYAGEPETRPKLKVKTHVRTAGFSCLGSRRHTFTTASRLMPQIPYFCLSGLKGLILSGVIAGGSCDSPPNLDRFHSSRVSAHLFENTKNEKKKTDRSRRLYNALQREQLPRK